MRYFLPFLTILFFSCSNTIYVVRHAEKAIVTKDSSGYTSSNPPLSEPGQVRAIVLREELKKKHIGTIFSTNYHRTINTAKPLSVALGNMPIQTYSPSKDSLDVFTARLKAIKKKSVLVVGHSNTVDDIVNKLTGATTIPGDLKDTDYDNLYIIRKKKNKMEFFQRKYGYPSNPEK